MSKVSEIVISKRSPRPLKDNRSNIYRISRNAGRILKQSAIPDIICWITVKIMELFMVLEDNFSLYDKTLSFLQYLLQLLLFVSTVGITASIEFLRAYHETEKHTINHDQVMVYAQTALTQNDLEDPEFVTLSVGGRIFKTRKSYLMKHRSYFNKITNSFVFIDRDAFYFEHILNYMRGNLSYLQIRDANTLRILLNDARFYELADMISDLQVAIQHRQSFVNYQFEEEVMHFPSWGSFRRRDQIIRISVRGLEFETRRNTIMNFKGSVLSDIFKDASVNDVFIDRDSTHFRHILNFYRGVNSTIDIVDYSQLKFLLKEVRFYRLDPMEKVLTNQMNILERLEPEDVNIQNKQSFISSTRGLLHTLLPQSFYKRLPYRLQSLNLTNCPVMLIVGNELFCANASSLLAYSDFSRMLQDTIDFTSEGYPKIWIDRQSKYFHYILNYVEGNDIMINITDVETLNRILEDARFFKLAELEYKLIKHRDTLTYNTLSWAEVLLLGIIASIT